MERGSLYNALVARKDQHDIAIVMHSWAGYRVGDFILVSDRNIFTSTVELPMTPKELEGQTEKQSGLTSWLVVLGVPNELFRIVLEKGVKLPPRAFDLKGSVNAFVESFSTSIRSTEFAEIFSKSLEA